MTDERFDDQDEPIVHEPLDVDGDNVLPLDIDGPADPVDVPDQPIPVHSDDDSVPADDVAVDEPEPVPDPEPVVDDVPDEDVEEEEIPYEILQRMAKLLRKRRHMGLTQHEAEEELRANDELRREVYSWRTWY